MGLGNDNSIHTFFEYEDDALSSFVEGERSKLVRVNNAFVMKGDDFISTYKLENICGIKIDVEGFELDVIRGLATTLSEQSPIIQIELIHTVPNAHETHKLLLELGYTAFYWEGDILTGTDLLKSTEYNYIYKKLTS